MKVVLILFLILALALGRVVAMWICYRNPVQFTFFHQSSGVILLVLAGVAALGGTTLLQNVRNPGTYLILYGLIMLVGFALTIGQLYSQTKGSRIE